MSRPRGYAVISDPALARPIERDTVTCNHCNAIVFCHDKQGRALHGVLVHCHGCGREICVKCAEQPKCTPLEKRLALIESRARLRSAVGG